MPLTPEGSKVTATAIKFSALSYEGIPEAVREAKEEKDFGMRISDFGFS
jgi:hypothetical protein